MNYLVDDEYFNRLNKKDLVVRGCSNIEEYKNKYLKNVINFTDVEMDILEDLCEKIDAMYHIPVQWKFVKMTDEKTVEHGFSHTVKDYIVLRQHFFYKGGMINMLIHEKIHVWQRNNKDLMDKIAMQMGYMKVSDRHHEYAECNPDVHGKWILDGKLANDMYSHPYEVYAYNEALRVSGEDI